MQEPSTLNLQTSSIKQGPNSTWNFPPNCHLPTTLHIIFTCTCTLSYAFSKFIKSTFTLRFFSRGFSPICFKVKIKFTQPIPDLKPPCLSSIRPTVTLRTLSTKISHIIGLQPCTVQQSQQLSNLQAPHHPQRPYYTTSRSCPPPSHFHHLLSLVTSSLPAAFRS